MNIHIAMDQMKKKFSKTILTIIQRILFLLLIAVMLSACKNKPNLIFHKSNKHLKAGKLVYERYCLACHQTNGSGVPGMYPPLRNSDRVSGTKDSLIHILLHGLTGEIEINGDIFNNTMPPQNYLTNQQIADVLTYIRSEFDNKTGKVTPEEVGTMRKKSP